MSSSSLLDEHELLSTLYIASKTVSNSFLCQTLLYANSVILFARLSKITKRASLHRKCCDVTFHLAPFKVHVTYADIKLSIILLLLQLVLLCSDGISLYNLTNYLLCILTLCM